jgi:hypothetical protein
MTEDLAAQWRREFQTASTERIREMLDKNPDLVNVQVTVQGRNGKIVSCVTLE